MESPNIRELLESTKTIAVVGCSTMPGKAAHDVPEEMQQVGFRVIPVHPTATEILGEKAYPRLADIPEPVDMVDVFRPAAECAGVAQQAVDIGAKSIWLQLGITSAEARDIAEKADVPYVENRCLSIEVNRLGFHK